MLILRITQKGFPKALTTLLQLNRHTNSCDDHNHKLSHTESKNPASKSAFPNPFVAQSPNVAALKAEKLIAWATATE